MLVIERKLGPACAAGSGGMEQPDHPSKGGVRLPRLRETRSGVLVLSDARLSRIAITRSVDAELAVGAALHMHHALSERREDRLASGDEQVALYRMS
jgi:hypothetical protein